MKREELEAKLFADATVFDFFQALRRLECAYRDRPRLGQAVRTAEEPIRLGQDPSLSFAPSTISSLQPGRNGLPPRLEVSFLGLLGPNGPLPLHLTEYARDRLRNAGDPTFARFLDVFNHRMLSLFYRAWADVHPTVSMDRPEADRFVGYIGSLVGIGLPGMRGRDAFPDRGKLFYCGRFGALSRNAEGLQAVISDHFKMSASVEEFVGDWYDLPDSERWRLDGGPESMRLGQSTIIGKRAWLRQVKFRVVLNKLSQAQFQAMLPEGKLLPRLNALVQNYVGDELDWDLRLVLDERTDQPLRLGGARLGWDAWLGRIPDKRDRQDLLLYPRGIMSRQARPAAA
jgi:type VI secretion system protein ImpH